MGSVTPEYSSRVPLATWFRYRAAAERSQTRIILLTQRPCAKSSAGLVLRSSAQSLHEEIKVFTGLRLHIDVERQRFTPTSNVVSLRMIGDN
jgi:recombination protein RecA